MKSYVVWLDTGVSIEANSEEEAIEKAKKKFTDQIFNNQVDYMVEEE